MDDGTGGAEAPGSTEAQRALAAEVAEVLAVLDVLGAQLTEVAAQVERSVVEVCGSFGRIGEYARTLVALTTEGRLDEDGPEVAPLSALDSTDPALRDLVDRTADGSEALTREIQRAVMGLQFQDAVSQRIAHVVATLGRIRVALRPHLVGTITVADGSTLLRQMEQTYSMEAERLVQARHTGELLGEGKDEDDHVELF